MRLSLSIILMISAGLSLALDTFPPSSVSPLCHYGLCRPDQLHPGPSYNPGQRTLDDLQLALRLDSANPYRWAEVGIFLDEHFDLTSAEPFFTRAKDLGAYTPPVLMVAANHYLIENQSERAFELSYRVLSLTPAFDDVLFATIGQMGRPLRDFLGTAIPVQRRPAVAWMQWLIPRAPESDLIETWHWLRDRGLADDAITGSLAQELWKRCSCHQGAQLWADWLGPKRGDYLHPELLFNRLFTSVPRPGPFDWTIEPDPAVEILPQNGLQLTFDGTQNLSYRGLRQMAAVGPGVYRFSALVESSELTTNQGLSFHIYDPVTPARLHVATPMVMGTTPRHLVEVEFKVTAPSCGVMVQLERLPSEKFDNKIAGTITVHEVSLRPIR